MCSLWMNLSSRTFIARTQSYFIYFYEYFSFSFIQWCICASLTLFGCPTATSAHFTCHAVDFVIKMMFFASSLCFQSACIPPSLSLFLSCSHQLLFYSILSETYNIYLLVFFVSFSITTHFLSICVGGVQIVQCPLNCNVNSLTAFVALVVMRKLRYCLCAARRFTTLVIQILKLIQMRMQADKV